MESDDLEYLVELSEAQEVAPVSARVIEAVKREVMMAIMNARMRSGNLRKFLMEKAE